MDNLGGWGTEIEMLGVATMLQVPVYTFSEPGKAATSLNPRWLKYPPLHPAMKVNSNYDKGVNQLVNMSKPPNFHLELLHFNENHYDLAIPEKGQRLPLRTKDLPFNHYYDKLYFLNDIQFLLKIMLTL